MAPRRRGPSVLPLDVPLIRAGWPRGTALLSERSLGELEVVADDPPAGPLLVLVSEFADVAADASVMVARGVLGAAFDEDFRVRAPEGDRWTVAEVEDVVSGFRRFPRRRHMVVLDSVERMDGRSLDRLLVVLEEPPTPLLVVLCVPSVAALPPTLRGRATEILTLEVLDERSRAAALVARGVSPAASEEAVALAGVRPSLAGLLAIESPLRPLAKKLFDPRLDAARPVLSAAGRVSAAVQLGRALQAIRSDRFDAVALGPLRFEDLNAEEKSAAKDLLAVWVHHRRRALAGLLESLDAEGVAAVEACLEALDVFLGRLRMPVSPLVALVELSLTSPPVRPRRVRG